MIKKSFVYILALVMCLSLTACTTYSDHVKSVVTDVNLEESKFKQVEDNSIFAIVYDIDTKVMYSISKGGYNQGTLTMLVNADGTPKLYEEDK